MRTIGTLFLLAVLGGASGCATHGVIVGGAEPPTQPSADQSIRGTIAKPAAGAAGAAGTKPASLAQAVVYVENLAGSAAPSARAKITATEHGFSPYVLAVAVGTTVEVTNRDQVYHNAFSISPTKHFDLGKIAPTESRSVKFDKPGVVNLFCELHSNATSFVIVLPNEVFTKADANGTFALPPLPKGTYTVKAWHPSYGERRCRVNLDGTGDVTVNLRF